MKPTTTRGMDRVSAHLDRGWDLLARGDTAGARRSARKALDHERDSPEAHVLLGAIANAEGDPDKALERFERAAALDAEWVEPLIHAADTLLGSFRDPQRALELCARALAVAADEVERADVLLLRADALLERGDEGDEAEARAALAELPEQLDDTDMSLRAGQLWLDLGDLDAAEGFLRRVLEREPELPDAWHGIGLVHEERGETREMVKAWLRVRELDLEEPKPGWGIALEAFRTIADAAFAELPPRIRELLANVPIFVEDYPAQELVAEGYDPRMLGFFTGVPHPEKSNLGGAPACPDAIFLYQRNIERMAHTREEVADEIRTTLLHETGHFFALSEEDLEAMGLG